MDEKTVIGLIQSGQDVFLVPSDGGYVERKLNTDGKNVWMEIEKPIPKYGQSYTFRFYFRSLDNIRPLTRKSA